MAHSCGCKQWDLTGIPCYHACASILYHRHNPEDYVDECYSKEAYLRVYAIPISSMPGPEEWPKATGEPIKPPMYRKQPGRPKKHSRRKEPEEIAKKNKISKEGTKVRCGNCRELGHNSKKCKKPASHDYVLHRENINLKKAAQASTSNNSRMKRKVEIILFLIFLKLYKCISNMLVGILKY
jgi:SWIM zinc finger